MSGAPGTPANPVSTPGDWTKRRGVIYTALVFCAVIITFVTVAPCTDAMVPLRTAMGTAGFYGGLGIIGSYVFGATWDDRSARKEAS